ncbi:interferon gamma receptor 1 isoform X2 [Tachysurus fulvidraco]|uniref:interferon gamma receptor 1 isoform X2 n=1 Tax=Tachysurus fulvidraco TaxID=1234273 RepID=UPI001FEFBF49|nr:interferon gamma receptor 1 isoform X2 [Tachysurus fulvidraco]
MRFNTLSVLSVLSVVWRLTHTVPAPTDVSVKCDSYGVEVEWTAAGVSEEAEFELELKDDFGNTISVRTKDRRYNISSLFNDTGYNKYFVQVKARDGEQESEFAKSQTFSFSAMILVDITCGLDFPPVTLSPKDGNLFVHFVNPLHLYGDTPALRNLISSDNLQYIVTSDEARKSEEFSCNRESKTCEGNISLPEKQDEYCVTLVGSIRQTVVRKTKPYCYYGSLYPGPPLSTYLIPLLASCAVFLVLTLVSVFLVKRIKKNIKQEIISMSPEFLKSKIPLTDFLIVAPEPVSRRVNVVDEDPLHMTEDIQENITQTETSHSSDLTEEEHKLKISASSESLDNLCAYGKSDDLSSGGSALGYDRPHTLVEISPGDMVQNYKC